MSITYLHQKIVGIIVFCYKDGMESHWLNVEDPIPVSIILLTHIQLK